MNYFIGYSSALEFWRSAHALAKPPPSRAQPSPRNILTPEKIATLNPVSLGIVDRPIHFIVVNEKCRTKNKDVMCHVLSGAFPAGSFVVGDKSIYITSPELTFALLACDLTIPELVKLGFELCGTYSLDPTNSEGFHDRHPITTVDALRRYVDRVGALHGVKKARRALCYIADNSASPMETILTMLLCLPCSIGGYGIALPRLNSRVDIVAPCNGGTEKKHYDCDLLWTEHLLCVEYDSKSWHSGEDQITSDSKRRADLIATGLTVVSITKGQVFNARSLDTAARLLAVRTDKTIRRKNYSEMTRRYELRMALLNDVFERYKRLSTHEDEAIGDSLPVKNSSHNRSCTKKLPLLHFISRLRASSIGSISPFPRSSK